MALLGYSVPETLTDDAGNAMKGITVTVTGPSAYSGTATTNATTGVLRLGPLPPGDYTVTYGSRSVTVPIVVSLPSGGTTGQVLGLGGGTTPGWVDPPSSGQPLDSDLTAIAALDSSTSGVLSTDGTGWIRKTYAQFKTALALTKGDVGLGNVDNTSDVSKPVSTAVTAAIAAQATIDRGTYSSYVVHGSTAGTSRPTSTGPVLWIGSVTPTNATAGDEWRDTTTDPYTVKIRGASTFTQVGGTSLASTFTSKTGAYTAVVGDFVECDTSSAGFTVTLPTNPGAGTLVAVKKVSGDTNTLTIAAAGGGTIDGAATQMTVTQWAGLLLEHKGGNVWRIAASMSTTGPAGTNGTNGTNATLSTIEDEGSALTARSNLNFTGAGVTATDAGGKTVVTIPGGSGTSSPAPHNARSGGWITTPGGSITTLSMSAGFEYAFPFDVPVSQSYQAIGISITTATAGGTIRLGVRNDNNGVPSTVAFDCGSDLAATAVTAVTATITQTLAPGTYWLCARAGGSGATVRATNNLPVQIAATSTAGTMDNVCAAYADAGGGSGALSGTFAVSSHTVSAPRVCLKTA